MRRRPRVDELDHRRNVAPRDAYRLALRCGFDPVQAGRFAAWCVGIDLRGTESGWTSLEVGKMVELRRSHRAGRLNG